MNRDWDWLLPASAIAMAAMFLAISLKLATGYPGHPSGIASVEFTVAIVTVAAFFRFMRHLHHLWRAGEDHPIARLREDFWPAVREFIPIVSGVVVIGVFLYSITFLKSMIPAVVPFWSDSLFAAIDRGLLINPEGMALALGSALPAIGLFYGIWHVVHIGGIIWVLHWRSSNKTRLILSFMLTWAIGMFMAFLFSSTGPLFTGLYDPAIAPATVRAAAEFLWANYKAQGALIGGGISAFPSMHVALAAWFATVLKDRGLPLVGLAYLASIFFCSIILGWHYVMDGVAGAAIAGLSNWITTRWVASRNFASHSMGGPSTAPC